MTPTSREKKGTTGRRGGSTISLRPLTTPQKGQQLRPFFAAILGAQVEV